MVSFAKQASLFFLHSNPVSASLGSRSLRLAEVNNERPIRNSLCIQIFCLAGLALAAVPALPSAAAPPDWWDAVNERGWVRNLPDFYQHQPSLDETVGSTGLFEIPSPYPQFPAGGATTPVRIRWQQEGGWCGAAALLDTMYQWNESVTFRGLIQDPNIRVAGAWLTPASNNILYNASQGTINGNLLSVNAWFNALGFGVNSVLGGGDGLAYREALVQQTNVAAAPPVPALTAGEVRFQSARAGVLNPVIMTTRDIHGTVVVARPATAIEVYKQQLVDNGYTVNIRIGRPKAGSDPRLWWAGSFHLVAGAGLDCNGATRRIYIADPDSNNGSFGANSGITNNTFTPKAKVPAIAAAPGVTPQPEIPAGSVIEVASARKYTAAQAAGAVPIPTRVVAGDGSTLVLAAGFESKYGFWDIAADGFTITDCDHDPAVAADTARYATATITALGITSTLNVGAGVLAARGASDWDTTVAFKNDILSPIDQVMLFPAQGALFDSAASYATTDPWGYPGTGKLFDLTGSPLSPGLSTSLTIGTPNTPMTEYDVFFRDLTSGQWTVRSTKDITVDVHYGPQVQAGFATGFEPPIYSASAGGTVISGQDRWYLPAVAGSQEANVHTYTDNVLGISVNPLGALQFEGGLGNATGPVRAQHLVDFSAGGTWRAEWDCTGKWNNAAGPAVNNIGSWSMQPSATARYFQQLMSWGGAGNNYQGPNSPPADHLADFQQFHIHWGYFTAASPTVIAFAVPGPAWLNLPVNHWFHVGVTWDFNAAQILSVSIRDITSDGPTTTSDVSSLGWYLQGGPGSTLPLPTDVRLFAGGNGCISAWDNLVVGPVSPVAADVGACCDSIGGCTLLTQSLCSPPNTFGGIGSNCSVCSCTCLGDLTAEGLVNGRDVRKFSDCIVNGGAGCACADVNHSGSVTPADIGPFVTTVLSGNCAP